MKVVSFLFSALLVFNTATAADRIVAVVNKDVITELELKKYLNALKISQEGQTNPEVEGLLKDEGAALDNLIEDRLVIQEARRKNMEVPKEWIDKRTDELIFQFGTRRAFEDALMKAGLTVSGLEDKTRDQFLMRLVIDEEVKSKIDVSPHEITAYYQKHKHEFVKPTSVNYRALKFDTQSKAVEAFGELNRSQNIEDILAKYSQNLTQGTLNSAEIKDDLKAVLDVPVGSFSQVMPVQEEYYLFIIDAKQGSDIINISDLKDDIWNRVYAEKFQQEFTAWLDGLKEKAIVKIFIESDQDQ